MIETNDDCSGDLTKTQTNPIFPTYCGGTRNNYGRTRMWWLPTIVLFIVISIALLGISFVFRSQFHLLLIGYASITGAIAFHIYTNAFSVFAMGVSIRSKRIILVGQDIIWNGVWTIVGTGILFLASFAWVLKLEETFAKF